MAAEQREHIVDRTVIEMHWLCAEYTHGKDIPAWLHHMLVYGRQRLASASYLWLWRPPGGEMSVWW